MAEDGGLDGGGGSSCGNGNNNMAWLCNLKWKINVRNIVKGVHLSSTAIITRAARSVLVTAHGHSCGVLCNNVCKMIIGVTINPVRH